jgi:hypothetical protein
MNGALMLLQGEAHAAYQSRSITCQMKPMDFFVWQDG